MLPGGAVVELDGVDAETAAGNPFQLIEPNAGLINYALVQEVSDTFLVSSLDEAIFDIVTMGLMTQDIWYQSGGAHASCAASRRNDFGHARTQQFGVCSQL